MSQKKKTVIFILGTSFSGSTLLGRLLAVNTNEFLSELNRFEPFEFAPDYHRISCCAVCDSQGKAEACPIFGEKRKQKIRTQINLLKKFQEFSTVTNETIIDSSKDTAWALALIDSGLRDFFDVQVLISCRNPIAYAFSENEATKTEYWAAALNWRNLYEHAINALLHRKIPFLVVQYEQLFQTDSLKQINLGLSSMLNWNQSLSLTPRTVLSHAIGGNFGVFLGPQSDLGKSERVFHTNFSASDKWKIGFYPSNNFSESRRWSSFAGTQGLSLLNLPGVLDTAFTLGYNVAYLTSICKSDKTSIG